MPNAFCIRLTNIICVPGRDSAGYIYIYTYERTQRLQATYPGKIVQYAREQERPNGKDRHKAQMEGTQNGKGSKEI
jgi:hypothetical protein